MKKSLLLHSCCAPCSTAVLERLIQDYNVTLFFYNPCILPENEYLKRLSEQERFLSSLPCPVHLLKGEYHPERFNEAIRGFEHLLEGGERCVKCYTLRLRETVKTAKVGGFDCFTTTLTVSPKKKAAIINPILAVLGLEYGVETVEEDFKKKGGYNRSVELSKEFGLYRQSYCGCGL